jgi:hypothetical protein
MWNGRVDNAAALAPSLDRGRERADCSIPASCLNSAAVTRRRSHRRHVLSSTTSVTRPKRSSRTAPRLRASANMIPSSTLARRPFGGIHVNYQQPSGQPQMYSQPPGFGHGQGASPPPRRQGVSGCVVALAVVGGLTVIVGGAGLLFVVLRGASTSAAGGAPGQGGLRGMIRSSQVIVDEEVAVSAGGWQLRGFDLHDRQPVQVTAEGRSNADKGFMLYVMDSANCAKFSSKQPFQDFVSFHGLKIRTFSGTDILAPGGYCAVVQNSENIFNTMVVHVRVVADPS